MKKITTDESVIKYRQAYTLLHGALVTAWNDINILDPVGHRSEFARDCIDRALRKAEAIIEDTKEITQ